MGKAMILYKVSPAQDYDLAKLEEDIRKIDKVTNVKREPIAFGLEMLKVTAVVDDKKENPQEVEDAIKATEGVQNIETESVGLIS